MVKFGGHVEAIREGDLVDSQLYLVPYNKIKSSIFEHKKRVEEDEAMSNANVLADGRADGIGFDGAEHKQAEDDDGETDEKVFINIWKSALKNAEEDFHRARAEMWQTIFAGISANDDTADPLVRGAHPGNAIKLYVDLSHGKDGREAQELLVRMKEVYRAASVNSEALRKLVKKSDKNRKEIQLSSKLLPLLYTSSLYTGQNMIQDGIGLLRELVSGEYDDTNPSMNDSDGYLNSPYKGERFKTLVKRNSEKRHQDSIDIRMMEIDWLKKLVRSIPAKELLPKLVAHRGFHNIKDRNNKRPVENSLSAYEMAWTCGIELCECDIALTKDEKLVLAHDENFERLCLDTRSANSKRKVGDLNFKELISMPLTNGVRPPLLIDVLRSASAISERSKIIIEIKPGNEISAFALARLLVRHPDLRSSVAMIMSFDATTMHRLRAELDRTILPDAGDAGAHGLPIRAHRRVTSYDHFGTMSSTWLVGMGGGGGSPAHFSSNARLLDRSMDMSSIGLYISQANLNESSSANAFKTGGQSPSAASKLAEQYKPKSPTPSYLDHRMGPSVSSNMPKLMLLTVADPPSIPCELQVKHNELERVDNWLTHEDGVLDGVYLQYEKEMMTVEGAAYLRELSKRFLVGIWGYAEKDPDNFETFEWLVRQGNCSFVNSDLPKHFRGELLNQTETLPPLR